MTKQYVLTLIAVAISTWNTVGALAKDGSFEQSIEFQASGCKGRTPLWLNANKYGLSSLNNLNAYARGIVSYQNQYENWGLDYKIKGDLVLPFRYRDDGYRGSSYTHSIILQQFYGQVDWRNIRLTIGSKQQPMQLRDNSLASGSQTFGINARPIPQGRLEAIDWWYIPGFRNWLAIRGHIAYGIMSDANWEESFAGTSRFPYNRWTRYHEKAGYLRIGQNDKSPLSLTLGLEMAAQFGGSLFNYGGTDQNGYRNIESIKLDSNLKSYWNAFVPGGGDVSESQFKNAEGNQLGSWVFRLDWKMENLAIGFYGDHFFEDHSSMFQLDYDGYGHGEQWDKKKDFKFFLYDMKDFQLGLDITFKEFKYLHKFVIEYINTTYQSGPIYHDHNQTIQDHIGGVDKYYNHTTLPGWQHWGQVIGNPLYLSPIYNTNGFIGSLCNRFKAWHFGVNGEIIEDLTYRVLLSSQLGWGTYDDPFTHRKDNRSILIEFDYSLKKFKSLAPFSIKAAWGQDKGEIRGDNYGLQMTLIYNPL